MAETSQTQNAGRDTARAGGELYRAAMEGAGDAVFILDANGIVIDANSAAVSLYGYERARLVGMDIRDIGHPATLDDVVRQMQATTGQALLFETLHVRADGTSFPAEVSSRRVELDDAPGFVSVVRDITSRHAADAEREALIDELADANRRLDGLVRIVSGALGTLERDDLFERTLFLIRSEMNADAAIVLETVPDGMKVRAQQGADGWADVGMYLRTGEGFAGRVAAGGAPLYVPDVAKSKFALSLPVAAGVCSMFGVPMYVGGQLWGVIELAWTSTYEIGPSENSLVQAAADRIVLAMVNAQLYERARRAEALSEALNEVNALVNSSFDLTQTMDAALGRSARALGCDTALLLIAEGAEWCPRNAFGTPIVELPRPFPPCSAALRPGEGGGADATSLSRYAELLGLADTLILPLVVRGRSVGVLLLGRRVAGEAFDETARDFGDRFAGAIAVALANAEEFAAEHRIAETLQEALLTTPRSVRGIEFSHLYRSATVRTRVGGDFYDLFELAKGRVGIVVGDVSGKGLEAAVLTSVIKDTIRAFAHDVSSPAEVISRANVALGRAAKLPEFASVFFGIVDTRTASLTYCSAGHPPAALMTEDGGVYLLEGTSPVIGAFEDLVYEECTTMLAPGEAVFLYTDGVTEARHTSGEFFGEERMVGVLRSLHPYALEDVPAQMLAAVTAFTGGRLSDDIALLAFRLCSSPSLGRPALD